MKTAYDEIIMELQALANDIEVSEIEVEEIELTDIDIAFYDVYGDR